MRCVTWVGSYIPIYAPTVIPAKPRSGAEPGPMPSHRGADGPHGSRVAQLRRLPGMTVREVPLCSDCN